MTESTLSKQEGSVAVVVIGRNEGERLKRCLNSLKAQGRLLVYVDSGSADDSIAEAESQGAEIVELDVNVPFTAARARNAGVQKLLTLNGTPKYIQFVDGDCEVAADWIGIAANYLDQNPRVAAVCGQRRERFPDSSIYNELCDYEWRKTPGPVDSFGGDVLIRFEAFESVDGYRDFLIAGEEPELSLRLRRNGWELHALDQLMTLHDAHMTKFSQWWRRMKRSGYAYALGAHLHGREEEHFWVWQVAQAWLWVFVPMLLTVACSFVFGAAGLLVLLVYPLQCFRLFIRIDGPVRKKVLLAVSFTLVRFPEFSGQINYLLDLLRGNRGMIIEYK